MDELIEKIIYHLRIIKEENYGKTIWNIYNS